MTVNQKKGYLGHNEAATNLAERSFHQFDFSHFDLWPKGGTDGSKVKTQRVGLQFTVRTLNSVIQLVKSTMGCLWHPV